MGVHDLQARPNLLRPQGEEQREGGGGRSETFSRQSSVDSLGSATSSREKKKKKKDKKDKKHSVESNREVVIERKEKHLKAEEEDDRDISDRQACALQSGLNLL